MYSATIAFAPKGRTKDVLSLFAAETGTFDKGRAGVKVERDGKGIRFLVEADDAVALRSTLHAITKLLSTYEKMMRL